MSGAKAAVFAVWVLCALAFLGPSDSRLAGAGQKLFWVLVVVHAVECAIFLPKLRRAPGSLAHHLAQTFLYGIVHVRSLPGESGSAGPR